jgi:hypothetical protein
MPSKKKEAVAKPVAEPKAKFMFLGKGKFVHVVRTKAWDLKHSDCQQVRKGQVAGSFKGKGMSAEAALALNGCGSCMTEETAKAVVKSTETPEARKARTEDARNEVLDRASNKKVHKAKHVKEKKAPKEKVAKPDRPKGSSKTKAGTRSTGSDTMGKAEALKAFCNDNGWVSNIGEDKTTGHTVVKAVNGNMVIHAYFIDGKYDVARHATIEVGTWSGTLRGAHAVRRQVDKSLDKRDRPHPEPGKGRSGPKNGKGKSKADEVVPEDESPEDAAKRVPFSKDDDAIVIIDAVKGKVIKWRNGISGVIEEGWVPSKSKRTTITDHPKTGKRILSFMNVDMVGEHGEVYGGERNVAVEKIIRVVG